MEHRQPHTTARLWFLNGTLRALRRDESLDTALGLRGPGRRTLQGRLRLQVRNGHLRAAVQAVAVDPELSDWQRACRLAPLVRRFMADVWPRSRTLDAPLADWPDWKAHVWHAARCDIALPTSARALYEAVTKAPAYSQHSNDGKVLAQYL